MKWRATLTTGALILFGGTLEALAQPEVTFEFENMFGQRGFYDGSSGTNNIPPEGFASPTGVSFQSHERLIVADRGNLKLQSCDLQGDCFWIGGDGGSGGMGASRAQRGTFDLPHGVETNSQGLIAVADEDNHWVQLCDGTSSCIFSGGSGSAQAEPSGALGHWAFPQDVAIDSQDRVFGLDTGNSRIQILRGDDLLFRGVFMTAGSALGQISNARGIAIDAQDRVIISDTGNNRIQICDTDAICTAFGGFNAPVGVEVDSLGRIWVADTGSHRIQVCDYQGGCVAFGSFGTGEGQFDGPMDVAVHPSGKVAVVDSNNHRIQIFRTEPGFQINAGLNDAWLNLATPGQGFFITVFPVLGKMFIAMFSYDTERPLEGTPAILGEAGHRWVTAFGDYAGDEAVLDAELTEGGIFDSGNPPVTQTPGYGTFTLKFIDCNTLTLAYDFPTLGLSGVINLTRIATDNVALCEALNTQ